MKRAAQGRPHRRCRLRSSDASPAQQALTFSTAVGGRACFFSCSRPFSRCIAGACASKKIPEAKKRALGFGACARHSVHQAHANSAKGGFICIGGAARIGEARGKQKTSPHNSFQHPPEPTPPGCWASAHTTQQEKPHAALGSTARRPLTQSQSQGSGGQRDSKTKNDRMRTIWPFNRRQTILVELVHELRARAMESAATPQHNVKFTCDAEELVLGGGWLFPAMLHVKA